MKGPKLNTGFELRLLQCQIQEGDHCVGPAGHPIAGTGQDVNGLFGHLGTRWLMSTSTPRSFSTGQLSSQSSFSRSLAMLGIQHSVLLNPMQLTSVHWSNCPDHSVELSYPQEYQHSCSSVCKITEEVLDLFIWIIENDSKQNWYQTEFWLIVSNSNYFTAPFLF